MSVGSGILGSIYSRLPQSNELELSTGEDDEEDLLNHARRFQPCRPSSLNTFDGSSEPPSKMGEYQPLGQDRSSSATVHINGFNNINYDYGHKTPSQEESLMMGTRCLGGSVSGKGNAPASKVDEILRHPMSAMRRVAFVMSILLCIFTIVAFLWVLPCEWASCPAVHRTDHASSWEKTLIGLEIIGAMTVVPNKEGDNLLLMVRGEINFPESATTVLLDSSSTSSMEELTHLPANGGGIMTLVGSTGEVAWFSQLTRMPRDIDCSLIDADADGFMDCLLVGAQNLLLAFNARTGTTLWNVHTRGTTKVPVDMDFPLILPDMDGDGVPELAVACGLVNASEAASPSLKASPPHNAIAMISGKTGEIIGTPYVVADCLRVQGLSMDRNWLISFTCQDAELDSVKSRLLQALYHTMVTSREDYRESLKKPNPEGGLLMRQHHSDLPSSGAPTAASPSTPKTSSFAVSGRRLTQENTGVCPDKCSVSVRVTDVRHGRTNETVWSDGGTAMYALAPAVLLPSDQSAADKEISGFVLKFWHWTTSSSSDEDSPARVRRSGPIADGEPSSESKEPSETIRTPRKTASIEQGSRQTSSPVTPRKNATQKSSGHTAHWLTERIVLLTFNATDIHPTNASQSEIQQLCTEVGCQPSLEFQEHSLLIADLDHDNSQEVVSYLTTYAPENEVDHTDRAGSLKASGRLQLVSKIRVVRLEAELPKLYKAFTKV